MLLGNSQKEETNKAIIRRLYSLLFFFTLFTALYMKGRYIIMNKFVKHSITQTKDYACSSEYAKDIAKNAIGASVGCLVAVFLKNVLMNYLNDED